MPRGFYLLPVRIYASSLFGPVLPLLSSSSHTPVRSLSSGLFAFTLLSCFSFAEDPAHTKLSWFPKPPPLDPMSKESAEPSRSPEDERTGVPLLSASYTDSQPEHPKSHSHVDPDYGSRYSELPVRIWSCRILILA